MYMFSGLYKYVRNPQCKQSLKPYNTYKGSKYGENPHVQWNNMQTYLIKAIDNVNNNKRHTRELKFRFQYWYTQKNKQKCTYFDAPLNVNHIIPNGIRCNHMNRCNIIEKMAYSLSKKGLLMFYNRQTLLWKAWCIVIWHDWKSDFVMLPFTVYFIDIHVMSYTQCIFRENSYNYNINIFLIMNSFDYLFARNEKDDSNTLL